MWTFAIAVGAAMSLVAGIQWQASRTAISIGFSFADAAFDAAHEVDAPLGGGGFVNFNTLARNAVRYASPGASRREIVDGIGRGIGRAAVHELAHMMAAGVPIDSRADVNSYEYASADRASQYYGDLRWTSAWPIIQQRIAR